MPRKQNITPGHYNKVLPERLRATLKARGILPGTLAEQIGVQRQAVNYYLNGDRVPDAEKLGKIAAALEVSCDYLLGLSGASSLDEQINAAEQITGLSAGSVEMLSTLRELGASDFLRFLDIALHDVKRELDFALDDNTSALIGPDTKENRLSMFLYSGLPSSLLGILNAYYKALCKDIKLAPFYFENATTKAAKDFGIDEYILFTVGKDPGTPLLARDVYLQGLKDKINKKLEAISGAE